jgi:hypothetical protein
MGKEAYNIRLKTARFNTFPLPNGQNKEFIVADGLGEFSGQSMVYIGEMREDEDIIHMPTEISEDVLTYAVIDDALESNKLRRGEIVTSVGSKGLWVPAELLQ